MGQLKRYDNAKFQRPEPPKGQGVSNQQRRTNVSSSNVSSNDNGSDSFIEGVIIGTAIEEIIESDSD